MDFYLVLIFIPVPQILKLVNQIGCLIQCGPEVVIMATFSHFQSIWKDFPSSPLIMEFVVLLYFVSSLYQIRKFPSIHRLLGDFHLFFYFIMDFYWILSNVFLNLSKLLYGFPFSSVNMINHSDLLSNVKSYIEYR